MITTYAILSLTVGALAGALFCDSDEPFWRFLGRFVGWTLFWPVMVAVGIWDWLRGEDIYW